MINISELVKWKLEWKKGITEVATISVILALALGLPLMLSEEEFLRIPAIIFYIFLFIIGFFGHVDDVTEEAFKKVKWSDIVFAIGIGLIGFLIIQALFFVGLTLLATQEGLLTMTKEQLLIFNWCFVIGAEELVFRDTAPFYISSVFALILPKTETGAKASIAIGFVISSILFGALHIWTYGFQMIAVVKAIFAGIILSIIRIFGGLLASWIAHFAYNTINIMGLMTFPLV